MNDVLDNIRVRVGVEHLGQSFRGEGCRLFMTGVSPGYRSAFPVHGLEDEQCDYVLFAANPQGNLVAAPMELKSGKVDASGGPIARQRNIRRTLHARDFGDRLLSGSVPRSLFRSNSRRSIAKKSLFAGR